MNRWQPLSEDCAHNGVKQKTGTLSLYSHGFDSDILPIHQFARTQLSFKIRVGLMS